MKRAEQAREQQTIAKLDTDSHELSERHALARRIENDCGNDKGQDHSAKIKDLRNLFHELPSTGSHAIALLRKITLNLMN
jgi:hypothetical protein